LPSLLRDAVDALKTLFKTTGTDKLSDPLRDHYDRLEAAYLNAGTYSTIQQEATLAENADLVPLRSLRNSAHRTVEFYPAKLVISEWLDEMEPPQPDEPQPGQATETLPARFKNVKDRIADIHRWSNLESEGRPTVRQFAMMGDLFWKISHREDDSEARNPTAVYLERIDPRFVTDFDKDERGFFTWLRLDTPKSRRLDNGDTESYILTEVYSKERRDYRRWEHDKPSGYDLEQLGQADELTLDLAAPNGNPAGYTGYDFIPVVHRKFRDIGSPRGLSSFGHALTGIREADRIATKLHEILFPDVTWVLERSGLGPDGLPLPPIELENEATGDTLPDGQGWARGYPGHRESSENVVNVGKDRVVRLPSGATMVPKIPQRDLKSLSDALAAQVNWNEQELPESTLHKLRDLELSGVAMRTAMMDVEGRATEAASNLISGMVQAEEMALSIGQVLDLEGFSEGEIGTWDNGDFEHTYPIPEFFPLTELEKAQAAASEALAIASWQDAGLLKTGLERLGFEDPKGTAAKAEQAQALATPAAGLLSGLPRGRLSLETDTGTPPGQAGGD
jgi:hypothetical protein